MEESKNQTWMLLIFVLLSCAAIYLLMKYPFAGVVLLTTLGALGAALYVEDVIWSRRLKLLSAFFGVIFVLHLFKLSTSDVEEKKQIIFSPEEQHQRAQASAKEGAYRFLKRINRYPEVAISPMEAANCLIVINRAEQGASDWATANDKCADAAARVDSVR